MIADFSSIYYFYPNLYENTKYPPQPGVVLLLALHFWIGSLPFSYYQALSRDLFCLLETNLWCSSADLKDSICNCSLGIGVLKMATGPWVSNQLLSIEYQ